MHFQDYWYFKKCIVFYLSVIVYSFVKYIVLKEVDLPFLLDSVQIFELKGTQTGKCLTDSTDKEKKNLNVFKLFLLLKDF